MNMTATTPNQLTNPKHVTINRLDSVEEELVDRIVREKDGRRIVEFCEKLALMLSGSYQNNGSDLEALREKLCAKMANSLQCSWTQAASIIELSLELAHAKLHGSYRRSNVDLGKLIATATGG